MVLTQTRSKRTASGGTYKSYRKLKQYELGSMPTNPKIGKTRIKSVTITGGSKKARVITADVANVYDSKAKKYFKAKIETVTENPANRHFVRRNIMTKGTIIQTDRGKARITSRPGQEGTINAVLI